MAWLTYIEAAQKLAIAPASVRQRARRGRWARRTGNDGRARVDVPDALLSAPTSPATSGPTPLELMRNRVAELEAEIAARPHEAVAEARERIAKLEAELSGQRDLVIAERLRADAEFRRAQDLLRDRDAWRDFSQRPWWKRLVS